jgi:hypothetical protein
MSCGAGDCRAGEEENAEAVGQKSEVGSRKSEVRSQESGVRSRSQDPEVRPTPRSRILTPASRLLNNRVLINIRDELGRIGDVHLFDQLVPVSFYRPEAKT